MLNALRLKLFETRLESSAKLEEHSLWLINPTSIDYGITDGEYVLPQFVWQ